MSKILTLIKILSSLIYFIIEISLIYLKVKLWFKINRRKFINKFREELKNQGIRGDHLERLLKIYSDHLMEMERIFLKQLKIKL